MALVTLFVVGGPFVRQVLRQPIQALRPWVMFQNYGAEICDLRLYEVADDGSLVRQDRCELLGYPDCEDLPHAMWRANTLGESNGQLRQICRDHDGGELRATLQCGGRWGWKPHYQGNKDICEVEAVWDPPKAKRGPAVSK